MKNLKNLNELINILKEEIQKIKSGDKVCIIHHDDGDGCTSAAMLSIIIYKATGQLPYLFPIRGPNNLGKNLFSQLRTINPDFVFTLDVTIDPKKLSIFNGFILDHHITNIQSRENMIYINPRGFEKNDEKVPPTSYMIYLLLKDLFPEERVAWIAAIGITEDHRVSLCKDIFLQVNKEFPGFLNVEKIDQEAIEKSVFGEMWDMVRSGRMLRRTNGAKIAVDALIECKDDPNKFINGLTQNSYALRKFYNNVNKEAQKILINVNRTGKFYDHKKVLVYEAQRSNINSLTSFASDKLRQVYPDWVVCVVGREFGTQNKKISIRLEQNRRKIDLVDVLEKIKQKMPALKGGGHKSAIGVNLPAKDVKKFFEEFLALI